MKRLSCFLYEKSFEMRSQELKILKSTILFEGLDDEVLRKIVGNQLPREFKKGHIIFQQDDEADYFYVILDGWVKLYRQMPTGRDAILHVFTKGESFAEAAIFREHRYPATAEVVADASILAISSNAFTNVLTEYPDAMMQLLFSMSAKMKQFVAELEQVKGRNSLQRVAYFLYKLHTVKNDSGVVELPYEKHIIASRLGIKPESLSRALTKLRVFGVGCSNNQITISDVSKLHDIAMGFDK